jgi:hypothetical protein
MVISASLLIVGLLGIAFARFITAVAADPYTPVTEQMLETAIHYFPDDAPSHARLAARLIETGSDSQLNYQEVAEQAYRHASRAAELSPWNYEHHLLLAAARELKGEPQEAEAAIRKAVELAPNNVNVHWQMANLLLRRNNLGEATAELRKVTTADPVRLAASWNLIWQASNGDLNAMKAVVSEDPKARPAAVLSLANFLVQNDRPESAADLAIQLDRDSLLASTETAHLIDRLISNRKTELAYNFWRSLVGDNDRNDAPSIWNGSFEQALNSDLPQFDWNLSKSKFARIGIDSGAARSGKRSLKIAYLGIDTTRLEAEIGQRVAVRPGARYRLECYVKTESLNAPDAGPQVVVTIPETRTVVAASATLQNGSSDWRQLVLDFVAPSDSNALLVRIAQTPKFVYVEPTNGTIWFDDFRLTAR